MVARTRSSGFVNSLQMILIALLLELRVGLVDDYGATLLQIYFHYFRIELFYFWKIKAEVKAATKFISQISNEEDRLSL